MKKEKPSKCTKCLTEISLEEFLNHQHRCKECNKLPNFSNQKKIRCTGCRHIPHVDVCNEGMVHSGHPKFEITQVCGCEIKSSY
jgi:hypothetical protein